MSVQYRLQERKVPRNEKQQQQQRQHQRRQQPTGKKRRRKKNRPPSKNLMLRRWKKERRERGRERGREAEKEVLELGPLLSSSFRSKPGMDGRTTKRGFLVRTALSPRARKECGRVCECARGYEPACVRVRVCVSEKGWVRVCVCE